MKRPIALLGLVLLAGCGGGHGAAVSPTAGASSAPASTKHTATAQLTITIPAPPKATSATRRPRYISSNTNSLSFLPDGSTTPQVVSLTPTSPGCSVNGGGVRTCTVDASAPTGANVGFVVSTFASADGSGTALSTVHVTGQTITAGATNPITLTLNAVVGQIASVTLSPTSFTKGTAGTATVTVNVEDPSGATIVVPPGSFVDPSGNAVTIALGDSDTSGSTTLSSTTYTGAAVTLSYHGGTPSSSPVTVTAIASAAASGSATASAQLAVNNPTSLYVLNVADDSIVEFPLPLSSGESPVRAFGAANITACGPQSGGGYPYFNPGVSSIAADPNGNVYAQASNAEGACTAIVSAFGAAAGPASAAAASFDSDYQSEAPFDETLAYDSVKQTLDVANPYEDGSSPWFVSQWLTLVNTTASAVSNQASPSTTFANANNCPMPDPNSCGDQGLGNLQPFTLDLSVAGGGNFVLSAVDQGPGGQIFGEFSQSSSTLNAFAFSAPGTQATGDTVLAMTADQQGMLYVLYAGEAQDNSERYFGTCDPTYTSATSLCADGNTHTYLVGYNLAALESGSGQVSVTPTFVLGGDAGHFAPTYDSGDNVPNYQGTGTASIAAANGLVVIANPLGSDCSSTCEQAQINALNAGLTPATTGELDVYDVSGVTGIHISTATNPDPLADPVSVLSSSFVRVPLQVAFGGQGTCSSACISGLRRARIRAATRPSARVQRILELRKARLARPTTATP